MPSTTRWLTSLSSATRMLGTRPWILMAGICRGAFSDAIASVDVASLAGEVDVRARLCASYIEAGEKGRVKTSTFGWCNTARIRTSKTLPRPAGRMIKAS